MLHEYITYNLVMLYSCKIQDSSGQEWQTRLWEKTKELRGRRQQEEGEEEGKVKEYREIGTHLKGYPEEDVRNALRLVSSFIRASDEVVEVIRIYNLKPLPHKWLNLGIFEALKL